MKTIFTAGKRQGNLARLANTLNILVIIILLFSQLEMQSALASG